MHHEEVRWRWSAARSSLHARSRCRQIQSFLRAASPRPRSSGSRRFQPLSAWGRTGCRLPGGLPSVGWWNRRPSWDGRQLGRGPSRGQWIVGELCTFNCLGQHVSFSFCLGPINHCNSIVWEYATYLHMRASFDVSIKTTLSHIIIAKHGASLT